MEKENKKLNEKRQKQKKAKQSKGKEIESQIQNFLAYLLIAGAS